MSAHSSHAYHAGHSVLEAQDALETPVLTDETLQKLTKSIKESESVPSFQERATDISGRLLWDNDAQLVIKVCRSIGKEYKPWGAPLKAIVPLFSKTSNI